MGQRQLLPLTSRPEDKATKLDQLLNQRVTPGGQELPTIKLMVTHIMKDADDLVFVLGVAS